MHLGLSSLFSYEALYLTLVKESYIFSQHTDF
jgi:hypothetical protein